jgi:hypothetical protein
MKYCCKIRLGETILFPDTSASLQTAVARLVEGQLLLQEQTLSV